MSDSNQIRIVLYFDVISPYVAFAWHVLQRYKKLWNMDLQLKPVFLGGVMQGSGNKPPIFLPGRAMLLPLDVKRGGASHNLAMRDNPNNFFDVAAKMPRVGRILLAAMEIHPQRVESIITSFIRAIWMDDRNDKNEIDFGDEWIMNTVKRAVGDELGNKIFTRSQTPEMKKKLKDNTSEALSLGAFGVPTMMISSDEKPESEFFFGSDRFEQISFLYNKPWHGPRCTQETAKL